MFTKQRQPVFVPTGDWKVDAPNLHKWISDYWFELEKKGALSIDEADIRAANGIRFPATFVDRTDVNTLDDYEESSTTPVPTSGTGAFTTVSSVVKATKIGNRCFYSVAVTDTTNGTAATYIQVAMPFTAAETTASSGFDAVGLVALTGYVTNANLIIYKYDGTYPGADGKVLVMSGSYRV